MVNLTQYFKADQEYFIYQMRLHNIIYQQSNKKINCKAAQFNININKIQFLLNQPVRLYQKYIEKLQVCKPNFF